MKKIVQLTMLMITALGLWSAPALAQSPPVRRVNVPHFEGGIAAAEQAIFWLGQVDSTANYADVRLGYTDEALQVDVHIFDRYLWYDAGQPPDPAAFTAWDTVGLYLHLDGNQGPAPTLNSYRFRGQLNHWQARADYQTADRGNGAGWSSAAVAFSTASGWRGEGLNNGAEARGWTMTFTIPFTNLGLSGPPDVGTVWGLGVVVHDRDDAPGTAIPTRTWPETLLDTQPGTWGQLHFGLPAYTAPPATNKQTLTIRRGLNATDVPDAHVGGHTTCGDPFNPNFFEGWGDANYAGYTQVNVQNQGDVADWPCYSKYYVTFPLTALPSNQSIISATFTLYQFGNAGGPGQEPQPSLIQAHAITEAWQESSLTWNNAPLAAENIAQTWVSPLDSFPGWPGVPGAWDVGAAVAAAYAAGQPLRLALYGADTAYHSGKFFTSSDIDDWNAAGRPTLRVQFGESVGYYLTVTPNTQRIEPGSSTAFDIQIQHTGGFTEAVAVQVGQASPPGLTVTASPAPVAFSPPGGTVGVTVTDGHAPNFVGGLWYTVPVTTSSDGGVEQTTALKILVGGQQVYLPVMLK